MEWIRVVDPNGPELDKLAERFGLHPLHIEDCRHRDQNAKIEEEPGYVFVVLKPFRVTEKEGLEITDLDIFLGRDFLITVEETPWPELQAALEQVGTSASKLRADQLFYRIAEAVVNSCLAPLDYYDDLIDNLQDEVLSNPAPEELSRLFDIKRNLILLRRTLANTRDVAACLQRKDSEFFHRDMWPFLRDIYDHVARNLDRVDMQRDLLSGSLDVYLSSVATRTNNVMKVLTVLGTIALPALIVSSIYGMNLKHLPWADSPHAGMIVAGIMTAGTAALLILLRVFHWL
jgi:magnesium transporter